MAAEAYIIYIDGMEIPVTPSAIGKESPSANVFYKLMNGETFTALQKPNPDVWKFEFYAFAKEHPSISRHIPQDVIKNKLDELKDKKIVFEFIVIRASSDISLKNSFCKFMTLEDHSIGEDARWNNNIKIKLEVKENFPLKTVKLIDGVDNLENTIKYQVAEAPDANKNPEIPVTVVTVE